MVTVVQVSYNAMHEALDREIDALELPDSQSALEWLAKRLTTESDRLRHIRSKAESAVCLFTIASCTDRIDDLVGLGLTRLGAKVEQVDTAPRVLS